jgi:hypothetical protein
MCSVVSGVQSSDYEGLHQNCGRTQANLRQELGSVRLLAGSSPGEKAVASIDEDSGVGERFLIARLVVTYSFLIGSAVTILGFLLGFFMPFVGLPLLICCIGSSIFLNVLTFATVRRGKSTRRKISLVQQSNIAFFDVSLVLVGLLLATGDVSESYYAILVFGIAGLLALILAAPAVLRASRNNHAARQSFGSC